MASSRCVGAQVLLCAYLLSASCALGLRKCCPQDEHLHIADGALNCTKVLPDTNTAARDWWLPEELLANSSRQDLQIAEGQRPDCDLSAMDVLRFDRQRNVAEFALMPAAGAGAEVRLAVFKESTLHDPGVARQLTFPPADFCVDAVAVGGAAHTTVALLCPCSHTTCVRKCCHDGRVLDTERGQCVDQQQGPDDPTDDFFDWVPKVDVYTDYYRLVSRLPKCDQFTSHVITTRLNESRLLLAQDGTLQALDTEEVFRRDEYCGAHSTSHQEMLIFCMKADTGATVKQTVYGSVFLFGAICLLATVIITAILPEMRRNLQSKMALAHNAMLFVGYLSTGISHLKGSTMSQSSCEVLSLIIQFSILAAFFWLNVMCIDISWTFSGIQKLTPVCGQGDRVKMFIYSLYAWGSTTFIFVATIMVEHLPNISRFKPKFGIRVCFFNDREAELLFFFGPMAVILIINLVLFIYIACKIYSANKQQAKDNSHNKEKLILYGKLFILMGVTWVTEIISWAIGGPHYFWYFTDLLNLLRAVFIFVIFCCKHSVYVLLRNKMLRALGKSIPDPKKHSTSTKSVCSSESVKRAVGIVNMFSSTPWDPPTTIENSKSAPTASKGTAKTESIELTSQA